MKNAGQSFLAPLSVGYSESFIGKLKAAPAHTCSEATEIPVTSWDNLGFDPLPTDYMYVMKCPSGSGSFSDGKLLPFGNIEFNPFSSVLNYGQGIIEGLKAHKKSDDSILLFRPEQNALRMAVGADRLCMVAPTVEQFVEAVKIPPPDKGFLHIRPLLLGTSPQLSLTPSSEFIFLIYVTPVRNYFEGGLEPIDLVVDDKTHRAVPGGVGHVKAIGNYAGILRAQATAKENGFSDVLYVDSVHNRYLEEVSTANIFVVKSSSYSHSYTSRAASFVEEISDPLSSSGDEDDCVAEVDWDNLGFGLVTTDYMYVMKCREDGNFTKGELNPYGNIELSPSAGVLNYGQGLFEGTKAFRKENGGLLLFRPDQNAMRMVMGAERMCMPCPSIDQFVDSVKQTALANKRWVPPPGKGTLYIRPLLLGTGPVLGLAPAPEYTFLVYASPVGNYFKTAGALNLYVEEEYDRSARLGTGGVKTISNYAPVLKAMSRAKSRGFSDVLYLDSVEKKNLEEVSSCNIFIVKGNVISTPAARGTILAGVEERVVPVDELLSADEVFCTGTAVVVAPVGSVTYQDRRVQYKTGVQSVTWELYSTLVGIQRGEIEDKKGWTVEIN
ncbi:unnamed protein product [Linum tenue]|uniref:Branched-chain-amino-acid transaminase n=1 Tax=Linum tenue TaxID=586396 RepID=A0AAV0P1Q5_9ROSI|nr:unnamed protein product [Linum tenue]